MRNTTQSVVGSKTPSTGVLFNWALFNRVGEKRCMKKSHLSAALAAVLILVLGFLAVDYSKAQKGEQARVFKSKSAYKYPDVVKFDDFQISIENVSKVPVNRDSKLDNFNCFALPSKVDTLLQRIKNPNLVVPSGKDKVAEDCNEAKEAQNHPDITVTFKTKNISDSVASLGPYRFTIAGDSSIDELKREIKSGDYIPGQESSQTIKFEYDYRYTGDYTLVITKDQQKKYISFNYPL